MEESRIGSSQTGSVIGGRDGPSVPAADDGVFGGNEREGQQAHRKLNPKEHNWLHELDLSRMVDWEKRVASRTFPGEYDSCAWPNSSERQPQFANTRVPSLDSVALWVATVTHSERAHGLRRCIQCGFGGDEGANGTLPRAVAP